MQISQNYHWSGNYFIFSSISFIIAINLKGFRFIKEFPVHIAIEFCMGRVNFHTEDYFVIT